MAVKNPSSYYVAVTPSADGKRHLNYPAGDYPLLTSYNTSFASVLDPFTDGILIVSRDPNGTRIKTLASPARAVSKQTGTPTFVADFSPLNFFNDAQAFINPLVWTPTQYDVQITAGPTSGFSGANKEIELMLASREDYAQELKQYGYTTTFGIEINWQHAGAYLIAGWYKEGPEIGRVASPPTPNSAGGSIMKARLTYDGSNRPNIQLWIDGTLQTWSVAGGDGATASGGTILIDTRHPGVYGPPGFGFYRDVDGEEAAWYITNFQAAGL